MYTPTFGTSHDARIVAVARFFALGAIHAVSPAAGTNDNYLVATDSGAFVIKFLVNTTMEELARGLPFLDRVAAAGFAPVVTYLRAPDGAVLFRDAEGAAVVLARLAGEPPAISQVVCHTIGQHLAQLHLIACDGLPARPHWLDDGYLPQAMHTLRQTVGAARIPGILRAWDALQGFDPASLPHSIVHGDLDTSNCLFDGDRLVAFLDWQDVGVGAALLDFAMTVLGFCFHEANTPHWHGTFSPVAYTSLYRGYTSVRPLIDLERRQLGAALQYVGLTQPVWSLLHWDQYHAGEPLDEQRTLYWRYGLDTLRLPPL